MKANKAPQSVDEYIAGFPKETQLLLQQLRAAIQKAVPKAEECISYQMPAYKLHGVLVYFAAFQKHIGFYPTSSGIANFQKKYQCTKTPKVPCNFLWIKNYPLLLLLK